MKLLKILTVLLLTANFANAQSSIANGNICPNITITDTKGISHNLYDYCNQGKYVVIDFFAYWCGPCKEYAPNIEQLYTKYGCNSGNIIVLGNESDPGGTYASLQSFNSQAGIDTNHACPTGYGTAGTNAANASSSSAFNVNSYPTVVLIGPDKKMINNWMDPIDLPSLESAFPSGVLVPKACASPTSTKSFEQDASISIAPNPVQQYCQLSVLLKENANVNVVINDFVGSKIICQNSSLHSGKNIVQLDIHELKQGIYTATIFINNKPSSTIKLLKN